MKYIGLDLHLENTFGTIMEEDGAILKQGKFQTTEEEMEDFLAGMDKAKIAIESSGFCMPWVEFLEEKGFEVFVAHPAKVRVIAEARIKTDKIDSKALAHLLRWALIEAVWVHIRHDSSLTRYFHRIARRKGGGKRARKRAAIATARKMLHVIYAMLRDRKPFDHDYLGRAG